MNAIRPAVATVKGRPGNPPDNALRANVEGGIARLEMLAPIVAPAVKHGKVTVVGGIYDLETGAVAMIGRVGPFELPVRDDVRHDLQLGGGELCGRDDLAGT